jgi:hypothetical protein
VEDPHGSEPISSEKLTCDLRGLMSSQKVWSAVSFWYWSPPNAELSSEILISIHHDQELQIEKQSVRNLGLGLPLCHLAGGIVLDEFVLWMWINLLIFLVEWNQALSCFPKILNLCSRNQILILLSFSWSETSNYLTPKFPVPRIFFPTAGPAVVFQVWLTIENHILLPYKKMHN